MKIKTYLGDSVYAEFNQWNQLVLTVEDGITIKDTIYLELEVWEALIIYMKGTE